MKINKEDYKEVKGSAKWMAYKINWRRYAIALEKQNEALNLAVVSNHVCPNGKEGLIRETDFGKQCSNCMEFI